MKVFPYIILSAWTFILQYFPGIPSISRRPGKYEYFPIFGNLEHCFLQYVLLLNLIVSSLMECKRTVELV